MCGPLHAEDGDYVPQQGEFPPQGVGKYIAGELVYIDPVNRRGGIRLDGDENGRYNSGPLHYFALLPYATVWQHGSRALIRDLPIGTHVHGYFVLPPEGEEETIPPLPEDQKKFAIAHNHALSLEDDFSFYQRRGQHWKVTSLDIEKGKIYVEPVGEMAKDGINKAYYFDIDRVTRVWKDRRLSELEDIKSETVVQLNLGWSHNWREGEFSVIDIWLDEASREYATRQQSLRHDRYQRERWVPGRIDSVEHFDFGGGIVTMTFFDIGPTLLADLKDEQDEEYAMACAEKTLRTWFHRADRKFCNAIEWKEIKDPSQGSSGVQVKFKFKELLNCYRPGSYVRVKAFSWKFVTMPPEERISSPEERERSLKLSLP